MLLGRDQRTCGTRRTVRTGEDTGTHQDPGWGERIPKVQSLWGQPQKGKGMWRNYVIIILLWT